ncbi:MAG: GNAT family N-acetyltransferase [Alphaproteobacteria bacterium]|nr:GNAT family N-acetyltransferase [Alphaproteobacteria bacterium]
MAMVLTTSRLLLRPFTLDDAGDVARLANNWKVASMLTRMPHPYRHEDAAEFLNMRVKDADHEGSHVFAITSAGELMGATGIHLRDNGAFELGYWLAERFWGEGYATEGVGRLVEFAFADLEVGQLVAAHFFDNPASGRVLRKLGFKPAGEVERFSLARGTAVLCHMVGQSREEWLARKTAPAPAASANLGARQAMEDPK